MLNLEVVWSTWDGSVLRSMSEAMHLEQPLSLGLRIRLEHTLN